MKNKKHSIYGLICGIINGLLGAGGGMVLVPMLYQEGLDAKAAHATSISVILPLCVLSSIMYVINGETNIFDALFYIIPGIIGSLIGILLLEKLNKNIIKKCLAIIMLWSAIRIFLK